MQTKRRRHGIDGLRLWFALALLGSILACGEGSHNLTIVVQDWQGKPISGIDIRLAGSEESLGKTDANGRSTLRLKREKGELMRVRLGSSPENPLPDSIRFESVYELTDAIFERQALVVRALRGNDGTADGPATATLHAESDPPGAQVMVYRERTPSGAPEETPPREVVGQGQTPISIPELEPGRVQVEFRLSGHHPNVVDLYLTPGETSHRCELKRLEVTTASLRIDSEPAGGRIHLDGRDTGQITPKQFSDLPAGKHRVKVVKDGFEPFQTEIQLLAGGSGIVGDRLRPVQASPTPRREEPPTRPVDTSQTSPCEKTYLISTFPGWADVFVDQESVSRNITGNFKMPLSCGVHRFRVNNPRAGVDRILEFEVKATDSHKKLILNYESGRVEAR